MTAAQPWSITFSTVFHELAAILVIADVIGALATGLGQIVFTSLFGFLLSLGLGFAPVKAIYIAVCLTFSSTIIIVKLLSDKREIDSLHGRIAVGFLVVQDIAVILAMILLTSFTAAGSGGIAAQGLRLLLVGTAFVLGTVATMRWVMPPLLGRLAQNQELLVLFAVAWAVGLATLAGAGAVPVCAGWQPADRGGDHGRDGLPAPK